MLNYLMQMENDMLCHQREKLSSESGHNNHTDKNYFNEVHNLTKVEHELS